MRPDIGTECRAESRQNLGLDRAQSAGREEDRSVFSAFWSRDPHRFLSSRSSGVCGRGSKYLERKHTGFRGTKFLRNAWDTIGGQYMVTKGAYVYSVPSPLSMSDALLL